MLNDQPGRIFPPNGGSRQTRRSSNRMRPTRIVVLDPVLASRVELTQAISLPGFVVDSTSSVVQAECLLEEHDVSLVLVDHNIGERGGLEVLTALRERFPDVQRALVTDLQDLEAIRPLLEAARLAFIVRKPWDAETLRRTIHLALDEEPDWTGWRSMTMDDAEVSASRARAALPGRARGSVRMPPRRDLLVRGLLAGLNACDDEVGLFRLVHSELASSFETVRSLWLDEKNDRAFSFNADQSEWGERAWAGVSTDDRQILAAARHVAAGAQLEISSDLTRRLRSDAALVGSSLHDQGERLMTLVLEIPATAANEALAVMGAIRSGLALALRRIHQAEARAEAARRLARRVSDELRSPLAELTSAVASLRSEAARAGMSADWVDRVTSESERIVRAVQTVEHEMRVEPPSGSSSSF